MSYEILVSRNSSLLAYGFGRIEPRDSRKVLAGFALSGLALGEGPSDIILTLANRRPQAACGQAPDDFPLIHCEGCPRLAA